MNNVKSEGKIELDDELLDLVSGGVLSVDDEAALNNAYGPLFENFRNAMGPDASPEDREFMMNVYNEFYDHIISTINDNYTGEYKDDLLEFFEKQNRRVIGA